MTTNREASALIAANHSVSNSTGSLRGVTGSPGLSSANWLNDDEKKKFLLDYPVIVYTVYSYDTPIYWVTQDGTRYRVQQKFSPTTSKHMGLCPVASPAKVEA